MPKELTQAVSIKRLCKTLAYKKDLKSTPLVNFNNTLKAAFGQISFSKKITNPWSKLIKGVQNILLQKYLLVNADEINTFAQIQQHFMNTFCTNFLFQKIANPNCAFKRCKKTLSYKFKSCLFCKLLMKLEPCCLFFHTYRGMQFLSRRWHWFCSLPIALIVWWVRKDIWAPKKRTSLIVLLEFNAKC